MPPFFVAPRFETAYYSSISGSNHSVPTLSPRKIVKGFTVKKLIITVLFTLLAAPAALAADRYISDDLFTFMHSGPNNTYRIIGSVNAGSKVQLIKTLSLIHI